MFSTGTPSPLYYVEEKAGVFSSSHQTSADNRPPRRNWAFYRHPFTIYINKSFGIIKLV
jgi:hypothetical protein